ncbi:coiled-coil domain-containing protein 121 [Phodopus roborovskii]|uniref:4930548H24Rik protein n=1 Tax=Phodopus roborovskii TaxID=109678 RepID=A0AAU9Z552_PHORO|nr:coiled-coil domain-containing protein 121 [Phodopus roborovskii]CAH6786948.1 4930548H24Rik [Phodopus roborovskii]
MEPQEQGNPISKVRSPRRFGNTSRQSARTNLVVETKKSHDVDPKGKTPLGNCDSRRQTPQTSSLVKIPTKHQTDLNKCLSSGTSFAQRRKILPQSSMYLTIINEFFKPERLTNLENKVKRRTMEALGKLSKNIEKARLQQERLLQESKLLQEEMIYLDAENNYFLRFLRKHNDQCRKKHEDLWNQYLQECVEMRQRKQELASKFAQQNADLQAQLLQGKSTQSQLKQQVQSLEHINSVKKTQEMRIQALQEELESMKAGTAIKDRQEHLQFLQRKALLDRQLQELRWLQRGERSTKEVKKKVWALESTARKVNSEFCASVHKENQGFQEELVKQVQEYCKLASIKRQLEKWKEQLKKEQWLQEATVRGRKQLKAKTDRSHNCDFCSKEQGATRPH